MFKDSVHLNCRDKLIKKRLQMQKITIRDLISCELTKSKLDNAAVLCSSTTTSTKSSDNDDDDDHYRRIKNELGGETTASTQTPTPSCRVLSSTSLASKFEFSPSPQQIMTATTTTTTCSSQSPLTQTTQTQEQDQENDQQESNENIIVIYDDTTCDDKDLLVESNPLKIVQENIRKAGIRKECKILKGTFLDLP